MRVQIVDSWDEFDGLVKKIKSIYCNDEKIVFRGQSNSHWDLLTTLERACEQLLTLEKYIDITLKCLPDINSKINPTYELKRDDIIRVLNNDSNGYELKLLCYNYWIYLRHFGFPSPMLDWTSDYNIASFFAFEEKNSSKYCSIYILVIDPSQVNVSPGSRIWELGHYTDAHERHKKQKTIYTMALMEIKPTPCKPKLHKCDFISHDSIYSKLDCDQDVLIKVNIPTSERNSVLSRLEEKDINHYTLFSQSEESLIKFLSTKYFR